MRTLAAWESFVKTVEHGSMAAAARRLDCTRAQISKQVAELERELGVRLFERSTRALRLTPAGEAFHPHALRTLAALADSRIALSNLGDTPRGLLRISASVTFGRLHIAPLLPGFTERYPELECELVLDDQSHDLIDGNIDLVLRHTRLPPDDAVARKLVALRRVLCATPGYLAAHGCPETPADLVRHRCFRYLLPGEAPVIELRDAAGQHQRIAASSRFRFNNIDCILDATLAGHGIAVLPTYLCGPEIRAGRLATVLDDYEPVTGFGQHLYACYLPNRGRLPKVRVFLDALSERFAPQPPWETFRAGP